MSECLGEEILQSYLDGELSSGNLEGVTSHLASCFTCATAAREFEKEYDMVVAALAPEFEASVPTERLRRRIDAAIAGVDVVSSGPVEMATFPRLRSWLQSISDRFTFTPQQAFAYAGLVVVLTSAVIFALIQSHNSQSTSGSHEVATVNPGTGGLKTASGVGPEASTPPLTVASNTGNAPPSNSRRPRNMSVRPRPIPSDDNHVRLLPGERSYLQTIAELDSTIKLDRGQMKPALQAEYERNLAFVDRALAAARTAAKSNPNDPDAADFMFSAYQSKVDLLNTVADARIYNKQH